MLFPRPFPTPSKVRGSAEPGVVIISRPRARARARGRSRKYRASPFGFAAYAELAGFESNTPALRPSAYQDCCFRADRGVLEFRGHPHQGRIIAFIDVWAGYSDPISPSFRQPPPSDLGSPSSRPLLRLLSKSCDPASSPPQSSSKG